jgi:hypothetical protein
MRLREYINRSIVVVGTPLSLVATLAATPLLLPITLPLIFLALVITLLLVLLALVVILLLVLVVLVKQLPQLLQPQPHPQSQTQIQSESHQQHHQLDSKPQTHIRNSSTSTFQSQTRRRLILNTPEFSHHRGGSCHKSEADTMVSAPIYDFTTNGTAFGIDSPRKKY